MSLYIAQFLILLVDFVNPQHYILTLPLPYKEEQNYLIEIGESLDNYYSNETKQTTKSNETQQSTNNEACECGAGDSPVCGEDEVTYSCIKSAQCGGVEVRCHGKCPCTACECNRGVYEPVCGVDGVTYDCDNKASCKGAGVRCKGKCPCKLIDGCSKGECPHSLTWAAYHPLVHHQEFLQYLQRDFPNISQVEQIGLSYEKRPILLLKICPYRNCGERPAIWIDGGIHPREWISPAAVAFLAMELVVNNEANKELTGVFDWYLLTIANPDGYIQTFSGHRLWRKNRNPKHADKCDDKHSFGVDLNRNFGYFWEDNSTRPNNPCSGNYHGEASFSEPETRAIRDFLWKLKGKVAIYNTVHAAGKKFVIPWDHIAEPYKHKEELTDLLETGRQAMGKYGDDFTIGSLKETYGIFTHGGAVNWAAGSLGVRLTFCTELAKKPDYAQMRAPPTNLMVPEVEAFVRLNLAIARKAQKFKWLKKMIKRYNKKY